VPTVLNVTPSPLSLWALVGAMLPVSNTPGSVALWAIVSEFNQFTVWPAFTVTGFGEYTPFLIVTVSRLGGFVPSGLVGEIGEVELLELPHPIAKSASRMTAPSVNRVPRESLNSMLQTGATRVPSRQAGPHATTQLCCVR
jgi:hypothetical protein